LTKENGRSMRVKGLENEVITSYENERGWFVWTSVYDANWDFIRNSDLDKLTKSEVEARMSKATGEIIVLDGK
jgi:hypothetical protein